MHICILPDPDPLIGGFAPRRHCMGAPLRPQTPSIGSRSAIAMYTTAPSPLKCYFQLTTALKHYSTRNVGQCPT